jgi:hypothetical protein
MSTPVEEKAFDLLRFDAAILIFISEFLSLKDTLSVTKVSRRLHDLMPRWELSERTLANYHDRGLYHDPVREFAQIYQYEDRNVSIGRVSFNFSWKDQCWGYRKGTMWVKLYRNEVEIASQQYPELAPQDGFHEISWKLEDESSPVITQSRVGDVIKVMIYIGGGGGHEMYIQGFNYKIVSRRLMPQTVN